MKVNLVGCGGISKCHLQAIGLLKDSGAELTAVADIVVEKADAKAEEFGCKAYYDYIDMLNNEKPDVVHICTPHYLHVDMAAEALGRGINVVLEKPCATSVESLKKLREAEMNSEARLAVCFQNRYKPSTVFTKKLIDDEQFGKVKSARAILCWQRDADYYNADEWRGTWEQECGGVLINQAIHTHDIMQYIIGKETKTVDGHISKFHLKDVNVVEDTASAYFTYEDGTRGIYFATNANGHSMDPMVEFVCENAVIRLEGDNVYKISGKEIELIFSKSDDVDIIGKYEWGNYHYHLIDDFNNCIKNNIDFKINSFEGGRVVAELLAVYESSKLGKTIDMKDFIK